MRSLSRLLLLVIVLVLPLLPAGAHAQAPLRPAVATAPVSTPPDAEARALIGILEDDAARARLIERLRGAAAPAPTPVAATDPSFARVVAEGTRAMAQQVSWVFLVAGDVFDRIGFILREAERADLRRLGTVAASIALVVVLTFVVFALLRVLAERILNRLAARAAVAPLPQRMLLILSAAGIDAASVVLAWAAGAAAALVIGVSNGMSVNQTLFLNAFLAAELGKLVSRTILKPNRPPLRLVPVSDIAAAYWHFWIARIVSLLGYAFLFVAPIIAANVSFGAAEGLRILAVFTAVVIGIVVVLQNKEIVRTLLTRRMANGHTDALARFYATLGRFWHVVAIVYLVAIFVIWLARPRTALTFTLVATMQSVVAVALGIVVTTFISRLISGGMRLPDDVKQRLPLLEARLNAFVPRVLQVVRLVVLAGVLITVAQAWDVFDFFAWASTGVGLAITTSVISAGFILLGGMAIYIVVSSWVEYRLNPDFGTVPTPRERTLLALFRNAFTVALALVVVIMALAELGLNIGPLLAGAGVIGLAVGFGAQKLVQDVITGIFIQLENAMNEGDVVSAGGISGVVERLTIRSVSIRDLSGVYHIVPFSSVDSVSNMMRHFSYHVADIGVAYRENIGEVKQAMKDAFERLAGMEEHAPNIIGPFEMLGVNAFADSAVVVRARIKTLPGKQWATGRAYNEIVKEIFDERGIEIPFPHVTFYPGVDKHGKAPPIHVAQDPQPGRGDESKTLILPEEGTQRQVANDRP